MIRRRARSVLDFFEAVARLVRARADDAERLLKLHHVNERLRFEEREAVPACGCPICTEIIMTSEPPEVAREPMPREERMRLAECGCAACMRRLVEVAPEREGGKR